MLLLRVSPSRFSERHFRKDPRLDQVFDVILHVNHLFQFSVWTLDPASLHPFAKKSSLLCPVAAFLTSPGSHSDTIVHPL